LARVSGPDLSGEVIDRRYQIVERVSEGAMGVVYRAVRLKLDRPVAVKVMHASLPGAMEGKKRFEREAQLMARLDHPHVVSIIDFGLHGDKPFVVMELVRGRSLHEVLVEQGKFEIPRAVDVMRQVLSGLAHAHEQGVIHRDIKPANIMLTPKAPLGVHARILDFGLARMLGGSTSLSNGVAVGTPSYMAPEQARGDALDARVDIYAAGVVLFEMLTGKKPLTASDPIQILKRQVEDPPPRLADIAPGEFGALEGVVARALAKAPADRFPSAVAMAEALDAALAGRAKPEPTAVMKPVSETSVQIPITVSSQAMAPADKHDVPSPDVKPRVLPPRPPVRASDPHDMSMLRRMLPVSRMRYVVLFAMLLIAAGIYGAVRLKRELAKRDAVAEKQHDVTPPPPRDAAVVITEAPDARPDAATELAQRASDLAATGKLDAGLEMLAGGRKAYPDAAIIPLTAGKLYMARYWWNDGIANLRDAIKLDPSLKNAPEVLAAAVHGFLTTPEYDYRLGSFVTELGAPAAPLLEDASRTHKSPQMRARAAAMLKRLH
jgi:serine/threonine protein kinase